MEIFQQLVMILRYGMSGLNKFLQGFNLLLLKDLLFTCWN